MKRPLPEMDTERLKASFARHRADPGVSIDQHEKNRRVELSGDVLKRERIYLDLKFWLLLRDVVLGRRDDPDLVRLLELLRRSVRDRSRICPISDVAFLELLKQQDGHTRSATAELIDELSEGVTLAHQEQRMANEVARFLYACCGREVFDFRQLAWTKLSFVLGSFHPVLPDINSTEQLVLQKAFFDHMWEIPLTCIESGLGSGLTLKSQFDASADRLNTQSAMHASSVKSFARLYENEFKGGLDLAADTGQQVMEQMWLDEHPELPGIADVDRTEVRRLTFNMLCAIFESKRHAIVDALPTLHIAALCHAAIRWDQKRKLDGNDLLDIHHAQAAIPYCDVFLTEKPLHALLCQKNVAIDRQFGCRIFSTPISALGFLDASRTTE